MNAYKQEFDQKREKIRAVLKEAEDFYRGSGRNEEAETFQSIAKQLMEGEFSIVVVGEFSAGKSTFLNALMGERILPSFTTVTTAAVNFLKHRDKAPHGEAGIVYYRDNTTQPLENADLKTIQKYVTTKGEISVEQKVAHLDLFLDSKFLQEGVTLVDSPGLNATNEYHQEITERQIERSSASIFMFRADQPGSKSDFEFLRSLKQKVHTIIFVMNRIDAIQNSEEESVESVVNVLKESYKKQFPEDTVMPEIWPIAAYPALAARSKEDLEYRSIRHASPEQKQKWLKASRMEAFEDRLWRFLTNGEKARQMLLEPVNRTINLISQEKKRKEEEREFLGKKEDTGEIKEQIMELEAQEKKIEIKINGLKSEIAMSMGEIVRDEKESMLAKIDGFRKRKQEEVDTWETIDDYDDYVRNFNSQVERKLKQSVKEIEEDMEERVRQEVHIKYSQIADEINRELGKNEVSLQISQTFEAKETSFSEAIEQYEAQIKSQRAQLEKIQAELDENDVERVKARRLEREKQALRDRVERMETEKTMYEKTFTPPAKSYREESRTVRTNRGGVAGMIIQFWFGKKEKEIRVTVDNQEEIDAWRQERDRNIAARNEKIREAEAAYQSAASPGKSSEELERLERQKNRRLAALEAEYKETQERFKDEFMKKQKAFLRDQKRQVSEYLMDISDEVASSFNKQMKQKSEELAGVICNAVGAGLREELAQKKKQREIWESRLESSENEKNETIARLTEEIESLGGILGRAIDIKAEVENEEKDTIGEAV